MWDDMNLAFLGSGFPLFYNFLKYCMIMLVFFICISGISNLNSNMNGKFCMKDLEVQNKTNEK